MAISWCYADWIPKNSRYHSSHTTPDLPNTVVEQLHNTITSRGATLASFITPPYYHRYENYNGSQVRFVQPMARHPLGHPTFRSLLLDPYDSEIRDFLLQEMDFLPQRFMKHSTPRNYYKQRNSFPAPPNYSQYSSPQLPSRPMLLYCHQCSNL